MHDDRGELLLVWKFDGPRFDRHGVDLRDIASLAALRRIIVGFARDSWLKDRPTVPTDLADQIRLVFYGIDDGCASIAIYMPPDTSIGDTKQQVLDAIGASYLRQKVRQAARRAADATSSASRGELMSELPREVAHDLPELVSTLGENDTVSMLVPEHDRPFPLLTLEDKRYGAPLIEAARLTPASRGLLMAPLRRAQEEPSRVSADVELPLDTEQLHVFGEVTRVDVRRRDATVVIHGKAYPFSFGADKESLVTDALHGHKTKRLRIVGSGIFDKNTRALVRVESVDSLECIEIQLSLPIINSFAAGTKSGKHSSRPTSGTEAMGTGAPRDNWRQACSEGRCWEDGQGRRGMVEVG